MKKLITALAVTTALTAGGAMAQGYGYGGGYGYGNNNAYYGAGVGADYGADLGYGWGYGAGLLGGQVDNSLYNVGLNNLYGSNVQGANGNKIGDVLRIVRNCNIYAVVDVNSNYGGSNQGAGNNQGGSSQGASNNQGGSSQRQIVVPLGHLIVTNNGVQLQGITQNNINDFPAYRAGIGLTDISTQSGSNVGGLYGATRGWGACQQFSAGGLGNGIGMANAGYGGGNGAFGNNGGAGVGSSATATPAPAWASAMAASA